MTKFKAGDKVRLVGRVVRQEFPREKYATMISPKMYQIGKLETEVYHVCRGWEVELIEESTEEDKFEDVQVGDRVRLTAANGDVAEITVESRTGRWLDSAYNCFSIKDYEKVEILTRAQKPLVPGLYESNRKDLSLVVSTDGTVYTASAKGSWEKVMKDRARHLVEYGGMELTFAF